MAERPGRSNFLRPDGAWCCKGESRKLWSNYGPAIVSQCSERAFGSHPCRVISVSYEQALGCPRNGFVAAPESCAKPRVWDNKRSDVTSMNRQSSACTEEFFCSV